MSAVVQYTVKKHHITRDIEKSVNTYTAGRNAHDQLSLQFWINNN